MAARCTILILEPGLVRRIMYRQALGADSTLIFAETPVEALTILAQQRPDLVLLRVGLSAAPASPGGRRRRLDGIDLCRMIKRSPLQGTPLVLCGDQEGLLEALRARRAGADRYLSGPISDEALCEVIGELLSPKIIAARLRTGGLLWSMQRAQPSRCSAPA